MGVLVRERPKGSGIYWVKINHKGKRKSKKIGNKKLAEDAARKITAQLALNDLNIFTTKPQAPLFKDYADNWLEMCVKAQKSLTTYERYQNILTKYVYPVIGDTKIDEIKRGDVRNLLQSIQNKGLSQSTVCLASNVISGPLTDAVDDEIIKANPVIGITKRLQLNRKRKIKINPMTREQVELFLSSCNDHYTEYYPFFLCACRTGLRLGELLALQWGDIDWNQKVISIQRSYKRGKITPPKTGKNRRVDMSDQLIEALQSLHTQRKREALQEGKGQIADIIFHKDKNHMAQNSVRYIFKQILKTAQLKTMRFHDIRHTYASILLSDGISVLYVKEQLGHTNIKTTIDYYGHFIPSGNRALVNSLDPQPSATLPQPAQMKKA
jgi:integrase